MTVLKNIMLATALVAVAFSTPAFAGSSATSGAAAGANAGASSNITNEGSVGIAGLAGGECVHSLTIGVPGVIGLGGATYDEECKDFNMAIIALNHGLIDRDSARLIVLPILGLREVAAAAVVTPAPEADEAIELVVDDVRYSVTGANLTRYNTCQIIKVGGKRVLNTSCR